jgi:nucleoid-associated protein YejK
MERVTLCDEFKCQVRNKIIAYYDNGKLRIEGQHSDPLAKKKENWKSDEFEFFYKFSREMTEKLYNTLKIESETGDGFMVLMARYFSGDFGDVKLRDFCEKHQIEFEFQTIVKDE